MRHTLLQNQQGIYGAEVLTKDDSNYNLETLSRLDPRLDLNCLARALDEAIKAHPYVKSRLVYTAQQDVCLETHEEEDFETQILDIPDIDSIRDSLNHPYDFFKDRLFRIEIYRTLNGNYLYTNFSHLIFDAWSYQNLFGEVSKAYQGQMLTVEGDELLSFHSQEEALRASAVYEEEKAWYLQEFSPYAETNSMPLPDKQQRKMLFKDCTLSLPIDTASLQKLADKTHTTKSTIFMAAFALTLSKYSGDDKVFFTTIYHGRQSKELKNALGMLVRTLPAGINLEGLERTEALLGAIRNQYVKTRNSKAYAFTDLSRDLGVNSDILFAYQDDFHNFALNMDTWSVPIESIETKSPGLSLYMQIFRKGNSYEANCIYPAHMYSQELIQHFMESYEHILGELLIEDRIEDIETIDERQCRQLEQFNPASIDESVAQQDIVTLFKKSVAQYPSMTALVYKEKHYTFQELDEMTDRLGAAIYEQVKDVCAKEQPVVSILISRNENMVIAPLAAMKAGCAYQPLDPAYPRERLNFMVKDANAALVIEEPGYEDMLGEYTGKRLSTGDFEKIFFGQMPEINLPGVSPEDAMVYLYTSGSTGVPKGVILEQRNIATWCGWYERYLDLEPGDNLACYASFGFDAHMSDIYPALTGAKTVHIIPEEIRLDLVALNQYFMEHDVRSTLITTAVAYQFATNIQKTSLKYLLTGGEKLASLEPPADYTLINIYGPTETTICVTTKKVLENENNIPIGSGFDCNRLYVVDRYMHRLPVGAPGELLIAGPQVGKGYLNRPEKTAEVFITDPFAAEENPIFQRCYRTGDIVRWRETGELEYVGRRDHQVKIHGYRIELKEVEAVIRQFDGITDATVQAFDDPNGGKFIAAYICGQTTVDIESMNAFIAARKPAYMVPYITMQIEKIPYNVNQKVDKKALPKPELKAKAGSNGASSAPLNNLEKEIHSLLADLLGTEDFGVTDPLASIGLTSINSIKLSALLYNTYGISLNALDLLEGATLQTIENAILGLWMSGKGNPATVNDNIQEHYSAPLSFSQQGVYSDCLANPESTVYNIPSCVIMPAGTKQEDVIKALKQLVAAHPALASHFTTDDSQNIIQEKLPDFVLDIPVFTITTEELSAFKKEFVRPFNLERGPLCRFALVQADRLYLLMDVHHLVSDGMSMDLMLQELCKALDGESIEPESYTCFDFALEQHLDKENEKFFDQIMAQVEEASQLIPNVYEKDKPHREGQVEAEIDLATVGEYARKYGISPAAVYLAAAFLVVGRYTCEEQVAMATISSGRSNVQIANTVGMFVNTLPLAIRLEGAERAEDFIRRSGELFTDIIRHENHPFAAIAAKYDFKPQIFYAYQVGVLGQYKTSLGTLEREPLSLDRAKFPICIQIFGEAGKKGAVQVNYDMALFSKAMAKGLAKSIALAADQLIHLDQVGDISLTDTKDWAKLDSYNQPMSPNLELKDTIVSKFKKVVAQYPSMTALVYKDKHYTFQELDEMTDRLGAAIYEQVKDVYAKEQPVVSILISRNENMVIAPLAAMKAGCAYQPLDPAYPSERLNFMVKDVNAALVIEEPGYGGILEEYTGKRLFTDTFEEIFHGQMTEINLPGVSPEDAMVYLYTSGSTGIPKGVVLEQRNIMAWCSWYEGYLDLAPGDNLACYASFGFDAHMADIYPALTGAKTVHIIPEEIRLDLVALNQYFMGHDVRSTVITTAVAYQFATNIQKTSLKYLLTGGEKLASLEPPADYTLINVYGPTETTICVTAKKVLENENNIPIGAGYDCNRLYVVDSYLHRLPVGAPGELLIAGPQVGRGYLNRPEKTAEVFITDPFAVEENPFLRRCYRTGDIVRWRENGELEYVGRRDHQVKIHGYRIELKEVEAVIRQFEGITDATVQAFDDPNGGKFIAAYICGQAPVDVEAMNAFIAERKPAYMVPYITMQIEKIPYNVNQKVDKKALPHPELKVKTGSNGTSAAPLNMLEKRIKALLTELLGTEDFGVADTLTSIGLTSINSIKLSALLYNAYGISLNAFDLLDGATMQTIENAILSLLLNGEENIATAKASSNRQEHYSAPLSFAQQGVYSECLANPESTLYNLPSCVALPTGTMQEDAVTAVRQLVAAHPALFSHFTADEHQRIIQEKLTDFTLDIPVLAMTEAEFTTFKKDFVRPFDLEKGPLCRFALVRADKLYLLMDAHHLVADGASIDLLFRELCQALDGKNIEPESYTSFDFAADQQLDEKNEKFFDQIMSEVEEASQLIPDIYESDKPHREGQAGAEVDLAVTGEYARIHDISPAAVYLAATFLAVGRYTCEEQVAMATISSGRSNVQIADAVGMFVNTLPLAIWLDEAEKTEDFIRRSAELFTDVIRHENHPFAAIATKYDFKPQISYAYQVGVLGQYETSLGLLEREDLSLDRAKLPISIQIFGQEGKKGTVQVNYDEALFSEAFAKGFAKSIALAAEQLIRLDRVGDVSLTDEADWAKLDSYNQPMRLDFDLEDSVVSKFKKIVAQFPDKEAAVYRDKSYTYGELDQVTDCMAACIYERLCKVTGKTDTAEEVISVIISRSEHVFLLPLAILKAGCGYEPLDPSYPQERLNFMVQDAGARLLIAERELAPLISEYQGDVLYVDELEAAAAQLVQCILPPAPKAHDLMIMLYTSGSTGTPKGCQIEHGNMVAFAYGSNHEGFYATDGKTASFASFGFDVCMSDTFCTLLNGATLHVIPEDVRMNLNALADYFNDAGITQVLLTTQVGVQFVQNYPQMNSLRFLVMGGEKLPPLDPSALNYTIINGYGPTENCCGVSLFPIHFWEPNVPIGKPMVTIAGYVLDKSGHRLPAGAPGEFCLCGPQVTRGYLNRPDKTAEAYTISPYNKFRMYHTGDIVRYRQDGNVEFVGRKDGQVKIRGFRVETKEVEAVIREYPGVTDATVQAYSYDNGGKYLAAFIVSQEAVDIDALHQFIKERKPAYMVPLVTMQIEKIPLTINQKVDKKALPKPEIKKTEYEAPSNKAEEDFCSIFSQILDIDKVGAADDFFELGGSSISAMRVVVAANRLGYAIVYQNVFENTTPQMLADFVGQQRDAGTAQKEMAAALPRTHEGDSFYGPGTTEIGRDGYDYHAINDLLRKNTVEAFLEGQQQPLGDVLLCGATGYLGIHVFWQLMEKTHSKVYCLIRTKQEEGARQRFQRLLLYYFGKDYEELFGSRIVIIEGDAMEAATLADFHIDADEITVINCAASVKHFAKGDEIERANLNIVRNLISWCQKNNARLLHVSTESVFGHPAAGIPRDGLAYDEHMLYVGQVYEDNQYVRSKFLAERLIYETILRDGLNAKVLRAGNLAPREMDGRFQINAGSNNYMNTLKGFVSLGLVPYEAAVTSTEFSPIDKVAESVLLLGQTPRDCVCFMMSNNHRPLMGDVIEGLREWGYEIRYAEKEEFAMALQKALEDPALCDAMRPFVAYAMNDADEKSELGLDALQVSYTAQILHRYGFSWPMCGTSYVHQFLDSMGGLKDEK